MPLAQHANHLAPELLAEIEAFTSRHASLHDVLNWAMKGQPGLIPPVISRAVIQDEYTHDIVVPWNGLYLVYGTT